MPLFELKLLLVQSICCNIKPYTLFVPLFISSLYSYVLDCMFNILSNAVSSLTFNIFLFILSSLLTYVVPTEHHILPKKWHTPILRCCHYDRCSSRNYYQGRGR